MSAPRIGFDATAALTQGGGIGRYTRELLEALLAENEAYALRLFAASLPQPLPVAIPSLRRPNVSFRQLPVRPIWLYRFWYRLRLPLPVQLFTGAIDLFHSPDFVLPPVSGAIPTLLTVHDLSFAHYPETFTTALVNYLNRVVPWSVSRATHILADSESTRRDLIQLYRTPEEKITVLYSGVADRFRPVTDSAELSQVREKYGIGAAPYVFTVGTLQPRKNIQMLIQAFKLIASETSHYLIIAGGKGWLYEEMLAEVERQQLSGRVRFIGFVNDDDLPALYSAATVFVFPSVYEGFGLPILESMACGTPVVASDASSLPEVAGEAAILLPPTEAEGWTQTMSRLIADEALRARLVSAGFEQAKRFSWRESARQLLQLYEKMLAR